MRTLWIVPLFLAGSLAAIAENDIDRKVDLINGQLPEVFVAEEEQDKQVETRTVAGEKLQDELPVGPYKRPMWTLHRVSPTTRIYLQVDPGEVEFEQWVDIRLRKKRSN